MFNEERSLAGAFEGLADETARNDGEPEPVERDQPVRLEYVQCALPGCACVFPVQQYFGKTQRFCCDVHRQRMRTLLIHARWVFESTGCFNALHVLRYLEILSSGMPPPEQPP